MRGAPGTKELPPEDGPGGGGLLRIDSLLELGQPGLQAQGRPQVTPDAFPGVNAQVQQAPESFLHRRRKQTVSGGRGPP